MQFVNVQTPEICMAAVQQDGEALKYVKVQTPEICLAAIQYDENNLKLVREQSLEMCLLAFKKSPFTIQYLNHDMINFFVDKLLNMKDQFTVNYSKLQDEYQI